MKEKYEYIKAGLWANLQYFFKWTLLSCGIGVMGGGVGSLFGHGVRLATEAFQTYWQLLFLLPAAGVIIVWLYQRFHEEKNQGTNMILAAISANEKIHLVTGPLIFISTILTHLTGGSAGREGAALQIGGSLGSLVGKWTQLDEKDQRIAVICGMSACFGALFGTPLAAAVFCIEVVRVGVLYSSALFPSVFASFIGAGLAKQAGLHGERFTILEIPAFGLQPAVAVVFLGLLCALVSVLLCMILHGAEHLYKRYLPNPYLRILTAGCLLIVLTYLLGTRDYNGSSMGLIEEAMAGKVRYEAVILKAVFTAVTLGAGYKGGEIVPTLCIGATFGCVVGTLLGCSPSLCAACSTAAVFAGVTNCPLASIMIAFEMFGFEAMPYFAIVVAISFALSGYYGLYHSQSFVYSKTRAQGIERRVNE